MIKKMTVLTISLLALVSLSCAGDSEGDSGSGKYYCRLPGRTIDTSTGETNAGCPVLPAGKAIKIVFSGVTITQADDFITLKVFAEQNAEVTKTGYRVGMKGGALQYAFGNQALADYNTDIDFSTPKDVCVVVAPSPYMKIQMFYDNDDCLVTDTILEEVTDPEPIGNGNKIVTSFSGASDGVSFSSITITEQ